MRCLSHYTYLPRYELQGPTPPNEWLIALLHAFPSSDVDVSPLSRVRLLRMTYFNAAINIQLSTNVEFEARPMVYGRTLTTLVILFVMLNSQRPPRKPPKQSVPPAFGIPRIQLL